MPEIKVLDQYTIDNIAAGEVVERPASVVKELVENAVDAGANAVTVEVKEGGIKFIRVTDNGIGIEKNQIPTAFLRHATSKITSVEDLMRISSLGFRGEALSSIAAVAQVELISKTSESLSGMRYEIHGGKEIAFEEIGCPEGTTFIVRNLFYNVPARKKFLKTAMTEASYIETMIRELAMSHPEISFKFINNNQNKLATSGNGNLKDVIYHLYGKEIAKNLLSCEENIAEISVKGYVGKPVISRGNRGYENYFINGRYIKSGIVSKAIEDAYKTYNMKHRYPFVTLMIWVPKESLDVNVHPTKMEVRFADGEKLYRVILSAVKNALMQKNLIPSVSLERTSKKEIPIKPVLEQGRKTIPEPFETQRKQIERKAVLPENSKEEIDRLFGQEISKKDPSFLPKAKGGLENTVASSEYHFSGNAKSMDSLKRAIKSEGKSQLVSHRKEELGNQFSEAKKSRQVKDEIKKEIVRETADYEIKSKKQLSFIDLAKEKEEDKKEWMPKFRLIGQLFSTYWLMELEDKFYIMDQHAAHEKINYEELIAAFKEKKIYSQQLAPPLILSLSMKEQEAMKQYDSAFRALGFSIEEFGGNEYCIREVPANLYGLGEQEVFIELLDAIMDEGIMSDMDIITDKIASMACKAAVKGNQTMSLIEAQHLLERLMKCENPYTCPHGRPTMISMTKTEIEKKFKRIV